jgi:CTP:molybdopterin cytidylyltransferase MocA
MGVIVPGVVLAAGRSRRMGRAKALLPTALPGQTFISRIVDELRMGGVDDVVVVVGPDGPRIGPALANLNPPPRSVVNPHPDAGQLSSLLVGLRAISRPGVGGMLVTLVDVPLIDAATVRALLDAHQRTGAPIVRPSHRNDPARHGHPVIFGRSVFDELQRADPHLGAKPVVRAHIDDAVEVPVTADGPFLDVDTPEAYERVFGRPLPPDTEVETG